VTVGPTRAVVFDMDGVLVDSGAHHRDAWRAMFRDARLTAPAEFWRLTIGRPADEAVALLVEGIDRTEARRLAEVKRAHYARLARRGTVAVAGAPAFVEALARQGVPRAVATSATRRDLERVLDELGLRRYFEVVVTADDVRWGKPNPEVYSPIFAASGTIARVCARSRAIPRRRSRSSTTPRSSGACTAASTRSWPRTTSRTRRSGGAGGPCASCTPASTPRASGRIPRCAARAARRSGSRTTPTCC
jgi:phosphoglycolate phosphatase-like HAD superfamily hydrolase